ncbi:hypothetical protein [uncultured Chryseobacterium sp.]|uniref:hypothetical protein n=1 Tax=uncultured Chryseobacterium sp. TaxID=259322 RepID=UPI0025DFF9CA|nr:hypothetical protein [uncultured Chryseobacterium sp.]
MDIYGFRKFANIFQQILKSKLEENRYLNIEEYLRNFFDYYEKYNAHQFFNNEEIILDAMHFHVYRNTMYIERIVKAEGIDEDFQLKLTLFLDSTVQSQNSTFYDVERDLYGDFSNSDIGYFYFSDFKEDVLNSYEISNLLPILPQDTALDINIDL